MNIKVKPISLFSRIEEMSEKISLLVDNMEPEITLHTEDNRKPFNFSFELSHKSNWSHTMSSTTKSTGSGKSVAFCGLDLLSKTIRNIFQVEESDGKISKNMHRSLQRAKDGSLIGNRVNNGGREAESRFCDKFSDEKIVEMIDSAYLHFNNEHMSSSTKPAHFTSLCVVAMERIQEWHINSDEKLAHLHRIVARSLDNAVSFGLRNLQKTVVLIRDISLESIRIMTDRIMKKKCQKLKQYLDDIIAFFRETYVVPVTPP